MDTITIEQMVEVEVDPYEVLSQMSDEDLLDEVFDREIPIPYEDCSFDNLRDQELFNAFLAAKDKYTYDELMSKLA